MITKEKEQEQQLLPPATSAYLLTCSETGVMGIQHAKAELSEAGELFGKAKKVIEVLLLKPLQSHAS